MHKTKWRMMTKNWMVRLHANGSGASWRHLCANSTHWAFGRRTDAGRVRCKNCGKILDEGTQMIIKLQKLKGIR